MNKIQAGLKEPINPSVLHHYTSVSTLALILHHKTLRFTRLDQFDDVTEGRSIGDFPFGKRLFASCWSSDPAESIPQWAMYGDAMKGVRISLPLNPFIWRTESVDWRDHLRMDKVEIPFSLEEMLTEETSISPTANMRKNFGRPVTYVSDVPNELRSFVTIHSDHISLRGEGTEIAFFKSLQWSFQSEFRYVLLTAPGSDESYRGDVEAYLASRDRQREAGINFITWAPQKKHIDLRLDPEALAKMNIAIGPLAPGGTTEIVEALVAQYAPGASVKNSILSGTIRPK